MAGLVSKQQRTVDPARFAMVPRNDVPRSAFDIQHTHKTTFDAGWLIPVYVEEVLPGDSIRVKMSAFCRLATPLTPLMDNLYLESFFFFVPNRLVWDKWERFMGEQLDPNDTTEFLVPQVSVPHTRLVPGDLFDYFGLTTNNVANSVHVNALPFRAYGLIWNDWFRDQDLQFPATVPTGDGADLAADYSIRPRGKRHDYFTSARPWPQKPMQMAQMYGSATYGGPPMIPGGNMTFPLAGAPVSGLRAFSISGSLPTGAVETGGRPVTWPWGENTLRGKNDPTSLVPDVRVLINDIRTANVVQTMMERNSRGGTRYAEIVRSHFGVTSPDARLQRPEFLGGGRTPIVINPVAQTSATGGGSVLGELAGIGTAFASNHGFSQSFTEHGHIIGMVNVRADLTYQNGINRMFFRRTRYDFYWPGLANLGEQAILRQEIYANGTADDKLVFGYQERWSEYKYKPNRVSGRFKSTAAGTLDFWHLAQNFLAGPSLNDGFIADNPPVGRVLAISGEYEEFLFDSVMDVRMVRPMPMFSIPGLGPRF